MSDRKIHRYLQEGAMSITDELRKYAQSWRETPNLMDDLDAGDIDGLLGDIEHIADRIDAEHEKATSRAGQLLADAEKDRDYNYANWQECKQKVLQGNITFDELNAKIECLEDELLHCIELPKDADGEYIHIGDVMESRTGFDLFPQFEVRAMRYDGDRWEVIDRLVDRYEPSGLRHHHAPTVEDVLRDVVTLCHNTWKEGSAFEFYDVDDVMKSGNIVEFAAKLRLAGDAE